MNFSKILKFIKFGFSNTGGNKSTPICSQHVSTTLPLCESIYKADTSLQVLMVLFGWTNKTRKPTVGQGRRRVVQVFQPAIVMRTTDS